MARLRRNWGYLVLASSVLVACGGNVDASGTDETGASLSSSAAVPGSYLVELAPGSDAVVDGWIRSRGLPSRRFRAVHGRAVDGLTAADSAELRALPGVLSVVPNRVISAGPTKGKPGGSGGSTGQVLPDNIRRINADQAWTAAPANATGAGVGIAIIDTGIDLDNADLNVGAECFSAITNQSCDDANGHGTHVSGIAAAKNDAAGVVGAAPDATVYAVRVLDASGSGTDENLIAGLDWVFAHAQSVNPPIRVANMSLGRDGTVDDSPLLHAALQNVVDVAGITMVVAAGNDQSKDVSSQIPAAYPEALAIAATTARAGTAPGTGSCKGLSVAADTASYFTTDGQGVAVSAPGEEAENVNKACFLQSVGVLSLAVGGGTTRMSGTSMATPAVTGVVALAVQHVDESACEFSPDAARAAITGTASRIGIAPLDSPASSYTFDSVREGVVDALGVLSSPALNCP